MSTLLSTSEVIADLIIKTNADYRGNLLNLVGARLILNGQGYTGDLFNKIANEYGFEPNIKLTLPKQGE